jgi:Protein of unknown function (DUF3237)
MHPTEPKLQFAFEVRATVGAPAEVGKLGNGLVRRVIPVTGGTFEGPSIRGKVVEGGADWQIITPDGMAVIDARYTLQTDAGHFIYISNKGIRHGQPEVLKRLAAGEAVDPAEYYFRTTPELEASAPELEWVRRHTFVCSGARSGNNVLIAFYKVL